MYYINKNNLVFIKIIVIILININVQIFKLTNNFIFQGLLLNFRGAQYRD